VTVDGCLLSGALKSHISSNKGVMAKSKFLVSCNSKSKPNQNKSKFLFFLHCFGGISCMLLMLLIR